MTIYNHKIKKIYLKKHQRFNQFDYSEVEWKIIIIIVKKVFIKKKFQN